MKHHEHGFSSLEKRDKCAGSARMERGKKSEDSKESTMGTRLHEATWTPDPDLQWDEAALVEYANEEILKIACEFGINTWIGEQTMDIHYGDDHLCFGTVDGHSDIQPDTEFAVLLELKYGYKEVHESKSNIQVASGSLALKQKFPQLKRVLSVVIMPRIRKVFRHEFTEFGVIADYIYNIITKCNEPNALCTPGSHCSDGYCKALGECQAVDKMSEELVTTGVTAITADNADSMYEKAMVVEKHLKKIKAECKRLTAEAGGTLGRLDIKESNGNREIKDLQAAYENVMDFMSVEQFLEHCSVKLGPMEKYVCDRLVGRGRYQTIKEAKSNFNSLMGVTFGAKKSTINLRKE